MAYRYAFIDPFVFATALHNQQSNVALSFIGEAPSVQSYQSVASDHVNKDRDGLDEAEKEDAKNTQEEEPDSSDEDEFIPSARVAARQFLPEESLPPSHSPLARPSASLSLSYAPAVLTEGEHTREPYRDNLEFAGKGVIAVSSSASSSLLIHLSTPDGLNSLAFAITPTSFDICHGSSVVIGRVSSMRPFPEEWTKVVHDLPSCLLQPLEKTTYWVSLDEKNGSIKYGKHYLSANLKLFEVTFKKIQDSNPVVIEKGWEWIKNLKTVTVQELGTTQSPLAVSLRPLPIVHDRPPYIVTADKLSLADLEANIVTVVGNLPQECQKLYANVAGANIVLNTPDFADLDEAIQYSVNTPGCIGHRLLTKKNKGDFNSTYLRITIGFAVGTSPGVPYVLEIWPAGHYSPIHDHGNSFAVIKVLSGRIFCYYFDKLRRLQNGGPRQLAHAELRQGDITWMSNENYQVHQLKNRSLNGRVCVTLQCYQYGKNDKVHDEHFHFLSKDPSKDYDDFDPTSDMSFTEFKRQVQAEWEEVKARLQA